MQYVPTTLCLLLCYVFPKDLTVNCLYVSVFVSATGYTCLFFHHHSLIMMTKTQKKPVAHGVMAGLPSSHSITILLVVLTAITVHREEKYKKKKKKNKREMSI
jgi:hypothetical protein